MSYPGCATLIGQPLPEPSNALSRPLVFTGSVTEGEGEEAVTAPAARVELPLCTDPRAPDGSKVTGVSVFEGPDGFGGCANVNCYGWTADPATELHGRCEQAATGATAQFQLTVENDVGPAPILSMKVAPSYGHVRLWRMDGGKAELAMNSDSPESWLVLSSPNGSEFKIGVSDAGVLSATPL